MINNSEIFIFIDFRSILMNAADSDSDIRSPTSLDTIQIGDKGETIKLPTKKVLICDICPSLSQKDSDKSLFIGFKLLPILYGLYNIWSTKCQN